MPRKSSPPGIGRRRPCWTIWPGWRWKTPPFSGSSHRPVLAEARQAHAADFFGQEYKLSRQEWWAKNQLVYTMQSVRWKSVLGKRAPVMTPYERKLSDALLCGGELNAEELAAAILRAFSQAGLFDGTARSKAPLRLHFDGKWALAMTKFLPTELVHTDVLTLGQAGARRRTEAGLPPGKAPATKTPRRTGFILKAALAAPSTRRSSWRRRSRRSAPGTIWAAICGLQRESRTRSTPAAARPAVWPMKRPCNPSETGMPTPGTAAFIKTPFCG